MDPLSLNTRKWAAFALVLSMSLFALSPVTRAADFTKIAQPPAYDWPTLLHDSARSGSVLSPAPYYPNVLAKAAYPGPLTGASASAGFLYLGGGSTLYALNSSTLLPSWTVALGGNIMAQPTVSDGMVFVGTLSGVMYAVDQLSGSVVWATSLDGPIRTTPALDSGGVFVGTNGGTLYDLGESTGAVTWTFAAGSSIESSPSVSGGVVAFGTDAGVAYFLDEGSGAETWSFAAGGPIESSIFLSNGLGFFGSNDSNVYAVDYSTMTTLWTFGTRGHVISTPIASSGSVFAASLDGKVYSLDAATGGVIWSASLGETASSMALANGVNKLTATTYTPLVFLASLTGVVFALNQQTGVLVWSYAVGSPLSSPAAAYTHVYVTSANGGVFDLGELKGATKPATFTQLNEPQTVFPPTGTIRIGANTAWGKYGIRDAYVTVTLSRTATVLNNANMTFITGLPQFNLYYDFSYSGLAPGTYKVTVHIEDANPKYDSHVPRCCGWVTFSTYFTIS